jgi:hypothetical protein
MTEPDEMRRGWRWRAEAAKPEDAGVATETEMTGARRRSTDGMPGQSQLVHVRTHACMLLLGR